MSDSENKQSQDPQDLPMLLIRTEHLLRRFHQLHHMTEQSGIDPRHGQGRILALLQKTGDITQKELGYLLDLRQQSLSELLRKLETAGYITRRPDPSDRRSMIFSLTEKGKGAEFMNNDLSDAFSCLNDEERANLAAYLTKISEHIEADLRSFGDLPSMRGAGRGPMRPPMEHGFGPHGSMRPPMESGFDPHGPMRPPMEPGFDPHGPMRPPMEPGRDPRGSMQPPMEPGFGHHSAFSAPRRPPHPPKVRGVVDYVPEDDLTDC